MRGPADTHPSPAGDPVAPAPDRAARYVKVEASEAFQDLKSRYRRFVFPVTIGALSFYFAYVLTAAYLPEVMAEPVIGEINVGIIFGLLQFVMTFAVTWFYVRFARTVLDPRAEAIRASIEDQEVAR